ncbi:MAG TPA: M1 family aminopeptidase [Ktedonobacterales bacterium]
MYTCGCRDLALTLTSLGSAASAAMGDDAGPSFALPGDTPVYAPDRVADVADLHLNVTLDFERKSVAGEATTTFSALFEQVSEVTFDAAELAIESVRSAEDDAPLSYWTEGEKLHVRLARAHTYGERFGVRVRYTATPRIGLEFVEPTRGNPDLPVQAWTQGETEYHHFWFPCHDFPNDRATTSLSATVPGDFFVLSNGVLDGVRENANGTKTYDWRMDKPYPAYLLTLVAGHFAELPDHWRDVPVNYYVPLGREADGHRMFDNTPRMIELYSQRFGVDYPFAKYGQIIAEMFTGAMENASATTHTYRLLADERASLDFTPQPVVAHELVHQWFGDMIAVRDWSHTWLKESFATYFEAVWTEVDRGQDDFRTELRDNLQSYLAADARGRRPIVYNVYRKNGSELFDRHAYEKGSLVLHMLRNVLGENPFWRGLQHYTRRNAWREVITADFERAIEEATGHSVARFFEQWVYNTGHPEFKVSYSWDDERQMAKLSVTQKQKVTATTPIFATPVDIGFMIPTSDADANAEDQQATMVTFRVQVEEQAQTFYFPLERRPLSVRFDQGGWLIKTLDFERPGELLRYQLRHDPDVLGRIEAAEALGKLSDNASVQALRNALLDERFWSVRAAIADALAKSKNDFALDALLGALDESVQRFPGQLADSYASATTRPGSLEVANELKARRGIVSALGEFRAPEQSALADRAAAALTRILTEGDPSYYVEAAAATALGKTRTAGAFDTLVKKMQTPSWNEIIRQGVCAGLGELGDPHSVGVLASWLTDLSKPMDARLGAANGLRALAATRRIDPGEAQTEAVEALIFALDDPWELVVYNAIAALAEWNDSRAIEPLERLASREVDERAVRRAREATLKLRKGRSSGEEARQLRTDLDALREENRKLLDRLQALETRVNHGRES